MYFWWIYYVFWRIYELNIFVGPLAELYALYKAINGDLILKHTFKDNSGYSNTASVADET